MSRRIALTFILVILTTISFAQEKPAPAAHAAAAKPASAANLPSEETVNGFMEQTFGYEPQLSWKIVSIKPAPAEGLQLSLPDAPACCSSLFSFRRYLRNASISAASVGPLAVNSLH